MEQRIPALKLYRYAPSEKNDLKQRLENKLNEVKKFSNSNINIIEIINYFKKKNQKSKKSYKTFTSILESVNTVLISRANTTSVTSSVTGVSLMVVPISAEVTFALSLGNKVLPKIKLKK